MKLYLLRHGHSPSPQEAKVPGDAARPLSKQGREEVRRSARHLEAQGGKPILILHSPLRRARETAEEVSAALASHPPIEARSGLANVLGPADLEASLRERAAGLAELLVVGHQPQLGEFAYHLTGRQFSLAPGGVIALELDGKDVIALWSANPGELPG